MKEQNERNIKIEELIEKLQLDLYKLKLVFDDIKSNTEDRIKHELEFRKTCFAITSKTWMLMEDFGYGKQFCGVPPEQYGEPMYDAKDMAPDAPEILDLKGLVQTTLDSISGKRVESKIEAPDATKEQWFKAMESIQNQYNDHVDEDKERQKVTAQDLTFRPDFIYTNIIMDEDVINAAKGFMVGPVGIFRNQCVASMAGKSFSSLEELKSDILVESKLRDMVLYMVFEKAGQYFWRGVFVDKI